MPLSYVVTSIKARPNILNKLIWHPTRKGEFSVKSTYHTTVSLSRKSNNASSSSPNHSLSSPLFGSSISLNSDGEYLKGKVNKARASTPGKLKPWQQSLQLNNIGRRSSLKEMQRGLYKHVRILM
ncbi:hypothetical protein IFM89_030597 [Coptis chinensis]|uniref:Uncharacterized protein n=1 Tax=Coptis chinensis TaxID=261450 RepID=A0A835LTE1_9MAGN|nr:hypothetical protein IFM89_030597 [Coptis chinensis]